MAPKKSGDQDEKQHIQVVVRCRPLNNMEKKQGSCSIIEVNKEKKEILVKDRPHSAPMKRFTFDHVFGPKASQLEVYKTTVMPVIEEVLQGYNCTVFAYGQTGSGKTYTMEGEKMENCNWSDDSLVGVIPRAMCQVFSRLNEMNVEYSVRVSYLEIYNEELIDLLGAETEDNPKLKIYDDTGKKGSLVITGLEDLPVHNKKEVYQILEQGARRKQTAATLMNAHSSRSHSLFMVSIHMKDTTIDGEELLKVGKLNLVDLAGSECIGRSGAVEKRAREAGSINQSLLTLGRVITALVEHAPHIPYRESKLTRLLKDSLGGHTKTSVIATITPASTFLEETLSTLEYAHRTRNITNKPEINQKLTKKTILKAYTEEIEKLRKELQAARDKVGVYLPTDRYDEMVTTLDQQKEAIKDYEEEIACLTSEMQKINEMFAETKEKLEVTTKQLDDTQQTLHVTKKTLRQTKKERDEQKHLVTEHVKTENVLQEQASQLLHTAEESTSDVSGLHAKLDRKHNVEKHNETAQEEFQRRFHEDIKKMQNSLKSYTKNQTQSLTTLKSDMSALISKSAVEVKGLSENIGDIINLVTGQVTELHQSQVSYNEHDKKWLEDLSTFCKESLDGEKSRQSSFHKESFLVLMGLLHNVLTQIGSSLNDVKGNLEVQLRGQQDLIEEFKKEQLNNLNRLKETGLAFAAEQKKALQSCIAESQKMYKSQTEQNERLAEETRQSINDLLENMLQKQKSCLKQSTDQLAENLVDSCQKAGQFSECLNSDVETMMNVTRLSCDKLKSQCTDDNTSIRQAVKQFETEKSDLEEKVSSLESEMNSFLDAGNKVCTSMADNIALMVTQRVELSDVQSASHQTATETLTSECHLALDHLDTTQTNQSKELTETIQSHQMLLENCTKQTSDWSESHSKELEEREQSLVHFFIEELKKDFPTGTTPERRQFSFPHSLVKMKEHDVILEEFRKDYMLNEAMDLPLPDTSLLSELNLGEDTTASCDDSSDKSDTLSTNSQQLDTKENEAITGKPSQNNRIKHQHVNSSKKAESLSTTTDAVHTKRLPLKARNQTNTH